MIACRRIPGASRAWAAGLILCLGRSAALGEAPGASATAPRDAPASIQMGSFLSSLKQAFNHDFDHEVVRGHFDVGTPPDSHRYYCLVDPATGKTEANGVGGQPVLRPDGMTAIKSGAVSFYSCGNAEQQGILVSAGYVIKEGVAGITAPTFSVQPVTAAPAPNSVSPEIDVAGVKLGMTPDQVRSVLKAKKLMDYHESAQTLIHSQAAKKVIHSPVDARFVNVISAWTVAEDGESYEVMFTPVPGRERVLAIIHSVAYAPADGVRERALETALVTKYGGYAEGALPRLPTWRIQSGGNVEVGDPCNRRGIFGGLDETKAPLPERTNIALKTTPEEFRFQIDHCGTAMVTEDHSPANGATSGNERLISRFTVTAYSPSIGLEGATTAMQLIQAAGETDRKGEAPRIPPQPNL